MESGKITSLQEVKAMDLVGYLSSLGIEPKQIKGNMFWYISPFREEKTPSFKINRRQNLWIDYGDRKINGKYSGGTIIDFAIKYHNCTIKELLNSFNNPKSFIPVKHKNIPVLPESSESNIEIISIRSLWSFALLDYLKFRKICIPLAEQFCKEVNFKLQDKIYFGIGFKNDSGGYEIRNNYAKSSSTPKDITTINNGSDRVIVFEGFMDFLSFLTIHQNQIEKVYDYVILNSVVLFERARPFMEKHQFISLYLDRDKPGIECTLYARSLSDKYSDDSVLYKTCKDLNHWLMNFGQMGSG